LNPTKLSETISPNTTIAQYTIISKLGEGGMGEVYLAHDTKLDRRVALKVLPADVASQHDRMDRFIREARSAAALSHPNIAQIHEISEQNGLHYIVMEFIDGVTLREKIYREHIELRKLLRQLQHVADGLGKAHAAGIVHRDLKPDNIMITRDDHVKILDFGLAKLVETVDPKPVSARGGSDEEATAILQQYSTPGMILGTAGYMSPEQAQGRTKDIDQRSDIFSFGCILYEAATGRKAFAGKDVLDSLHQIVHGPTPQVKDIKADAPDELQRIVRRCLAKDPNERYQSIKDVAIELKELRRELEKTSVDTTVSPSGKIETAASHGDEATSSQASRDSANTIQTPSSISTRASSAEYVVAGIKQHKLTFGVVLLIVIAALATFGVYLGRHKTDATINSIAVMPFVNESGNQDVDYLSDGMTEALISSLSQLPNLNVKARSSVFRYKGKESSAPTIGRELNVEAVLNGRVSQRGDQLTLTLELVNAQNENVIWSEQYNRKQADLVTLQSEIARDVSTKLKAKLSGAEEAKLSKTYTTNPQAYQLYLKGRFFYDKRTKDDLLRSIQSYEQAITLDSNFALANVGIGNSYSTLTGYGYAAPNEVIPKAMAAVQRALQLDPDLAEAHAAYANLLAEYDWNWAEAEREFKRSIELNPNIGLTHFEYGNACLAPLGRFDEATFEMKRAMELEPLSVAISANTAGVHIFARRYSQALDQGREALRLEPTHPTARFWMGLAYVASGMYEEAVSICEATLRSDPANQDCLQVVGYAFAKQGRRREAEEVIRRFEAIGLTGYAVMYRPAAIHALLGDKEKAFEKLEKAYAAHDWDIGRIQVDPFVDSLRDDPRFKDLIKRMRFPQ
jgi:eukaryotic-like serine/threonine-protein kinase